jgi:hypothetical protein
MRVVKKNGTREEEKNGAFFPYPRGGGQQAPDEKVHVRGDLRVQDLRDGQKLPQGDGVLEQQRLGALHGLLHHAAADGGAHMRLEVRNVPARTNKKREKRLGERMNAQRFEKEDQLALAGAEERLVLRRGRRRRPFREPKRKKEGKKRRRKNQNRGGG